MARLTIDQIQAPDLTGASNILANAQRSWQAGMTSAQNLLGTYQEGRERNADSAFLAELAKVGSEEEYDNFLKTGNFDLSALSDGMREKHFGFRDKAIGYEGARADIDHTRSGSELNRANVGVANANRTDILGRLGLARNADGRLQELHGRQIQAENDLYGATPYAVGAMNEARAGGIPGMDKSNVGGTGTPNYIRYANQGAVRDKPLSPQLVDTLSFIGDMGLEMVVVSGGETEDKRVGESGRHLHGNAADFDLVSKETGKKLDWNQPLDRALISKVIEEASARGAGGIGAGDDYMGNGRLHIGFGKEAVWGANGKGENTPDWVREAYERGAARRGQGGGGGASASAGVGPRVGNIPDVTQPQGYNPLVNTGPAYNELNGYMTREGLMITPEQMRSIYAPVHSDQVTGQDRRDTLYDREVNDRNAALLNEMIRSPEVMNQAEALRYSNQNNTGRNASEQLAQYNATQEYFSGAAGETLGTTTKEGVPTHITNTTDLYLKNMDQQLLRDPDVRLLQGADAYEAADIPLEESLKRDLEGMDVAGEITGATPAKLRGEIKRLADANGITPAQAAYALKEAAEGYWQQNPIFGTDTWATAIGDGLSQDYAGRIIKPLLNKGDETIRTTMLDHQNKKATVQTLLEEADLSGRRLQKAIDNGVKPSAELLREVEEDRAALYAAVGIPLPAAATTPQGVADAALQAAATVSAASPTVGGGGGTPSPTSDIPAARLVNPEAQQAPVERVTSGSSARRETVPAAPMETPTPARPHDRRPQNQATIAANQAEAAAPVTAPQPQTAVQVAPPAPSGRGGEAAQRAQQAAAQAAAEQAQQQTTQTALDGGIGELVNEAARNPIQTLTAVLEEAAIAPPIKNQMVRMAQELRSGRLTPQQQQAAVNSLRQTLGVIEAQAAQEGIPMDDPIMALIQNPEVWLLR